VSFKAAYAQIEKTWKLLKQIRRLEGKYMATAYEYTNAASLFRTKFDDTEHSRF